ncbi:MAG: hypothetical protein HRU19_22615 [Pseudobacteriovorax sp.]|nr:hypothetical protein [Pseudobacteriovorax sp.]
MHKQVQVKSCLTIVVLGYLTAGCVTLHEKVSMISGQAIRDLGCPDSTAVTELDEDLFTAECAVANKGLIKYRVKCGYFPNSCQVIRLKN